MFATIESAAASILAVTFASCCDVERFVALAEESRGGEERPVDCRA